MIMKMSIVNNFLVQTMYVVIFSLVVNARLKNLQQVELVMCRNHSFIP